MNLIAAYESGVKQTFVLKTKGGKSIRATTEHLFETPKGWMLLGSLHVGDKVRVVLDRGGKARNKKNNYRVVSGLMNHPFHGRKGVKKGKGGFSVPKHRIVAEAKLNKLETAEFIKRIKDGKIRGLKFLNPKKWHVHHKDENPLNNDPSNLEVMKRNEHYSHHAKNDGWRNVNFPVGWDEIKSIEYYGEEPTYDLSMESFPNNFIANGFVVHNSGKTVIGAHILHSAFQKGKMSLFFAHRRELIHQCSNKLKLFGLDHGILMSGEPSSMLAETQIASIQTFARRVVKDMKISAPLADVVMIDEAHHATSNSYLALKEIYPDAIMIGLTATPVRSDGRGLGKYFDCLIEVATPQELIDLGHLVDTKIVAPRLPDLKGVRTVRGDYEEKELQKRMEPMIGDLVRDWKTYAADRSTLVFAVTVAHSVWIKERFENAGIVCEHVDAQTPMEKRDRIFDDFLNGRIPVLTNVGIATEGTDLPIASCAILARPTKSYGLYLQMAGRICRTHPGKKDCIAEGQLVLTDRGLVPIEKVRRDDRLWDGFEWVSHEGTVCKGYQEVIQYAGLTATKDHLVRTRQGWKTFIECATKRIPISQTGIGWKKIPHGENYFSGYEICRPMEGAIGLRSMYEMPKRKMDQLHEFAARENERMSCLQSACSFSEVVLSSCSAGSTALYESENKTLAYLRRTWNKIQIFIRHRGMFVDQGKSWYSQGFAVGSQRQRWSLRDRKSSVVNTETECFTHNKNACCHSGSQVQISASRSQICGQDVEQNAFSENDVSGNCGSVEQAFIQTKRKVWDIFNAGPRHCFTVSGLLVHNCLVIDHSGNVYRHGFPQDAGGWELDEKFNATEKNQQRLAKEPNPITCRECFTVYTKQLHCPNCGAMPTKKGISLAMEEGRLYHVERKTKKKTELLTMEQKAEFFGQLKALELARGKKPGWAAHMYRSKTGTWPNHPDIRHAPLRTPTPEVKSYVLSRQIAYAKSRDRQAAR